eukprot:CAMPEP_0119307172 /NCGR_PEP_ID=MMETSP1333-20130426/7738_1 /TAXON_ID=418940 /ORGANISM="Scyphosphaera apsteinii, Strain RCC1455" /LENGTH=164 /DNA_ID=CAMNT_0007310651 /DNA_START=463 /DNA_END=957 /DNA_ORIENTATION=-
MRVSRLVGDKSVVLGQIHGDSLPSGGVHSLSEWEMVLKLQFSSAGVCAHVKTPVPIREIIAGPCAPIHIGELFEYQVTMNETKQLTVLVVHSGSGVSYKVADSYDYSFYSADFLQETRFYFKAGAYCGDDVLRLPSEGCSVELQRINTTHPHEPIPKQQMPNGI